MQTALRIYLAARYGRRQEMESVAEMLNVRGFRVTSTWHIEQDRARAVQAEAEGFEQLTEAALVDCRDILKADLVISFTDGPGVHARGGRHAEFGMAVALNKRAWIVGKREHVFHYLPQVFVFEDLEAALKTLADSSPAATPKEGATH